MELTDTVSIALVLILSLHLLSHPLPQYFSASATDAASCIPSISRFSFSHHRFETCSPGRVPSAIHRSIMGLVAMYFTTVFWIHETKFSISWSSASTITFPRRRYVCVPYPWWGDKSKLNNWCMIKLSLWGNQVNSVRMNQDSVYLRLRIKHKIQNGIHQTVRSYNTHRRND